MHSVKEVPNCHGLCVLITAVKVRRRLMGIRIFRSLNSLCHENFMQEQKIKNVHLPF